MSVQISIENAENGSTCSAPVVSQHNDVKGMLVPGNNPHIPWYKLAFAH